MSAQSASDRFEGYGNRPETGEREHQSVQFTENCQVLFQDWIQRDQRRWTHRESGFEDTEMFFGR